MSDASFPIFVAPLSISALEVPLPENVSHDSGHVVLSLVGDLVGDTIGVLAAARNRYVQISGTGEEPHIVPLHDAIMRHVIRPLKEAKQCYVLGMPVACIAQAGFVGEMVALWRFRMVQPTLDGRPLDEETQRLLLGSEFDKLGQEARIRVLRAVDTLDTGTVQAFGQLRAIRRQYMHFMVDAPHDADKDARDAYRLACILVVKTLGMSFDNGKVILPPKAMNYIRDIFQVEAPRSPQPPHEDQATE